MWFGIALYTKVWWLILIFSLAYWIYYERIIVAEENYLEGKFGEAYFKYAQSTPCIIPNFKNYIPNKFHFRIKKVLRQENSSIYGLILVFLIMGFFEDLISRRPLIPEKHWLYIGISMTIIYLVLRYLKKSTHILKKDPQREKNTR